jgi:hypothetical protein
MWREAGEGAPGFVVVQDTRAFVEIFEVPRRDKHAERQRRRMRAIHVDTLRARLDVRLFEQALMAMERAAAEPDSVSATPGPPSEKELRAVRAGLARARARATARAARERSLTNELVDDDGRERTTRWYRLHTEFEHIEWSEAKFAKLAGTQRTWPVRVATSGRVRWWWYLDRFWAEDEGLGAGQLRARVLEDEREHWRRHRAQRLALEDALAPPAAREEHPEPPAEEPPRGAVARCVECGSGVDVVFDTIPGDPPTVELRCVTCRSRRLRAEEAALAEDYVVHERELPWRHDEVVPAGGVSSANGSEAREHLGLPSLWIVSPDDVRARRPS